MCFARPRTSDSIPSCDNADSQDRTDRCDVFFAIDALAVQLRSNSAVLVRVLVTKRQIFEFPLQSPDTQAVCQRRKDLERLLRDAQLPRTLLTFDPAQRHDAFSEFEDRNAHVVDHRNEHPAHVVHLIARFPRQQRRIRQFEQAYGSDALNICYQVANLGIDFTIEIGVRRVATANASV